MNAENAVLDEFDQPFESIRARLLGDDFRHETIRHASGNDFDESSVIAAMEGKIDENELGT